MKRVDGHLGEARHRAEAVEYRIEQHAAKLGDRLERLWQVVDACRTDGKQSAEVKR